MLLESVVESFSPIFRTSVRVALIIALMGFSIYAFM